MAGNGMYQEMYGLSGVPMSMQNQGKATKIKNTF